MSVTANDIKFYLTGAGSDGGSQASPNAALGSYRSSTEVVTATLDNLFDDVSSSEATTGSTEYRCFCIKNTASETLYNIKIWIYSETDPNSDQVIYFAVEVPETANLTNGDAQSIVNETTAPTSINTTNFNGTGSGISNWSTAAIKANGLSTAYGAHDDDLDAGEICFIWIKRVIDAGSQAQSNMAFTIRIEGDTL